MKRLIETLAISALLLAPASAANAQISFGITIGPQPPPRYQRVAPQPGPDYTWVDGYWYPVGSRYVWHAGYWTRPPYAGAYWVEPYHDGRQYIPGRWEGDRGPVDHNHRWDRGRQRDDRSNDRGNGRGNNRR